MKVFAIEECSSAHNEVLSSLLMSAHAHRLRASKRIFRCIERIFDWHRFCITGVMDGKGAIDEPKESE
jgi:hypothetical protein